jgi:hypothetical protein
VVRGFQFALELILIQLFDHLGLIIPQQDLVNGQGRHRGAVMDDGLRFY